MKTGQEPQLNFNPYNVFRGFTTNQFNDLLPVGLLALLVEHCTGIAEVKVYKPETFQAFFSHLQMLRP